MLRKLLGEMFRRAPAPTAASRPVATPPKEPFSIEPGAVVFVVEIDRPLRVSPDGPLDSERASLRLRTHPIARALSSSKPVYLLPAAVFADGGMNGAIGRIGTLVVAKHAAGGIIPQQRSFEGLIDWLARADGSVNLVADLTDNYAAFGTQSAKPFLVRFQQALGEHCRLTVPCEALREDLRPYAQRGIDVIDDPYETPQARAPKAPGGDPVRLCWFGSIGAPTRDLVVRGIAEAARGLGGRPAVLDFVAHRSLGGMVAAIGKELADACPNLATNFIPWSRDATWEAIDRSDIVLLPQDHRAAWGRVKSPNRLVETLRGGRLAVASPVPSYLELGDYAWIGEDLAQGVAWALANPEAVLERVSAGQRHVAGRFAPERSVAAWAALLGGGAVGLRLNLGCGDKILPGYVNVDIAPSRRGLAPDVLCDLHQLTPFETDSAQEVLAVHVIEHFWRWEVVSVLREWARVLAPGGRMVIECPNLLTACEEIARRPETALGAGVEAQRTMWVLYGDPAWKDPLMCHRWNYTPASLAEVMREAGLVNIRQEPAQFKLRDPRDMRVVGEKPPR